VDGFVTEGIDHFVDNKTLARDLSSIADFGSAAYGINRLAPKITSYGGKDKVRAIFNKKDGLNRLDKERSWRQLTGAGMALEAVFSASNIVTRAVDDERWK